jgi:hypothetical protein
MSHTKKLCIQNSQHIRIWKIKIERVIRINWKCRSEIKYKNRNLNFKLERERWREQKWYFYTECEKQNCKINGNAWYHSSFNWKIRIINLACIVWEAFYARNLFINKHRDVLVFVGSKKNLLLIIFIKLDCKPRLLHFM